MQIHVYIEQVLFDNLLMDFSLLFCARTLAGRRQSIFRLFLAAILGALYACLMPIIGFLSFLPLKLALPCVMAAAAFASKINSLIKKRKRSISGEAEFIVTINGRTVRLHAFIDSGNCLKDNLSGVPVAIASQEAAKQIMDNDFIRLLNGEIPAQLPGIHIIGYKSVGDEGVLYGIRPQDAQIIKDGKAYNSRCILAFSRNQSFCGEYEAIINPDMLKEVEI